MIQHDGSVDDGTLGAGAMEKGFKLVKRWAERF